MIDAGVLIWSNVRSDRADLFPDVELVCPWAGEDRCGASAGTAVDKASFPWMKLIAPARCLPRNPLISHPTADCPLPTAVFFSPLRRAQA